MRDVKVGQVWKWSIGAEEFEILAIAGKNVEYKYFGVDRTCASPLDWWDASSILVKDVDQPYQPKYKDGDILQIVEDVYCTGAPLKAGEIYVVSNTSETDYTMTELSSDPRRWEFTPEIIDKAVNVKLIGQEDEEVAEPEVEAQEVVSVEALREAFTYLVPEYLDIEQLIKLAQRLS